MSVGFPRQKPGPLQHRPLPPYPAPQVHDPASCAACRLIEEGRAEIERKGLRRQAIVPARWRRFLRAVFG